jgi:hypothetical protein
MHRSEPPVGSLGGVAGCYGYGDESASMRTPNGDAVAGPATADPRWPLAPHDDTAPLYGTDDFRIYGFKVRAARLA